MPIEHNEIRFDICYVMLFSQKGNMLEHTRVHTGEKPFACDVCPRAFATRGQLKAVFYIPDILIVPTDLDPDPDPGILTLGYGSGSFW
jgi:hypothetical protein